MSAQPSVVIASFEDESTALDALRVVKEAQQEEQLKLVAYALVRRDEEGKLHVKETGDPGGVAGAALAEGEVAAEEEIQIPSAEGAAT